MFQSFHLNLNVNATVGSVVVSTNVAVIVDKYPTYPFPVIVTPCDAREVSEYVSVVAPCMFVNVNDVDATDAGVHVNVNVFPVDPDNDPIVPLEVPSECDCWKCC